MSAKSTARHVSASKVVIMLETLVILSLSWWIVEEYLNNMYLREYVSGVFQTDGLIIGMLGTLLVLGSVSSLMFVRRRHGEKRFGAVSLEVNSSAGPRTRLAAEASTKTPEVFSKPSMDFHPVVAALKADMADRRMSFGSMVGAETQSKTVPPSSVGVQKASVLDQLTPNRQAPITGPRQGQLGEPFPQQPLHDSMPQPPVVPRVEQHGALLAQRSLPVLRPQEPAGSRVLQPSQQTPPQIPTNVTTVITGILPAQKKKDPTSSEEKPSPSQ